MATKPKTPEQKQRKPRKLPEPIPDTPENVARAIMRRPPKKNWRYQEQQKGRED